jgi:hypothetical protein
MECAVHFQQRGLALIPAELRFTVLELLHEDKLARIQKSPESADRPADVLLVTNRHNPVNILIPGSSVDEEYLDQQN